MFRFLLPFISIQVKLYQRLSTIRYKIIYYNKTNVLVLDSGNKVDNLLKGMESQ